MTLVKLVPLRAFATHPLYPMAKSYQQLLTSVTSMNTALAPSPLSHYNQSAKHPVMASASILHHTQPVKTSTQAFATAAVVNHLQSTSAMEQLDQSA